MAAAITSAAAAPVTLREMTVRLCRRAELRRRVVEASMRCGGLTRASVAVPADSPRSVKIIVDTSGGAAPTRTGSQVGAIVRGVKAWIPHERGRALLGEVPDGVELEICADVQAPPADPVGVEFWVPPFLSTAAQASVVDTFVDLRAVQLLSAGADVWIGRLPDGVTLCDARGVHDSPTAEWVVAAILSYLREFPAFARAQARREWSYAAHAPTDELAGKRVLVVGAGSIGAAIGARLAPFEVELSWVARTPRPDEGVYGTADLPALLPYADIVVVIVPLTAETRGMVDAGFLATMRDGALLVNAARGPVADTDALTAALASRRIGAALDVTDPEPLPPDHPLWDMPNVLLTPHVGGSVRGLLPRAYRLVGAQLRRYIAGEPLVNQVVNGY
jgi:phosphoglycerate dehydrogenase-like enzyme